MTDATRPIGFGYVREHFLMSTAELARAKARIVAFMRAEGFTLQGIFVERVETAPAAFEALIEAVNHHEATAVVVPSLSHLKTFEAPANLRDHLERATGARSTAISARQSPPSATATARSQAILAGLVS